MGINYIIFYRDMQGNILSRFVSIQTNKKQTFFNLDFTWLAGIRNENIWKSLRKE